VNTASPCHTNPFSSYGTIIEVTIAVLDVQERGSAQAVWVGHSCPTTCDECGAGALAREQVVEGHDFSRAERISRMD